METNTSSTFNIQNLTRFLPLIPAIGIFAGLVTFLGRLYLESYYSYFGVPPSALEMEVQDYAFGSFPMILFVLVVTVSVTVYWMADKPGLLGRVPKGLASEWIWPLVKWVRNVSKDWVSTAQKAPAPVPQDAQSPESLQDNAGGAGAARRSRGDRLRHSLRSSPGTLLIVVVGLIANVLMVLSWLLLILIAGTFVLTVLLLGFSILGIGASLRLIELLPWFSNIDWDIWNIPGLRGVVSGGLLALGTLLLISIIEALMSLRGGTGERPTDAGAPVQTENALPGREDQEEPTPVEATGGEEQEETAPVEDTRGGEHKETTTAGTGGGEQPVASTSKDTSDSRRWVSPLVLLMVVIVAMPVVTHFMARDQAFADLNTRISRFFTALPQAEFTSNEPLANGELWSSRKLSLVNGELLFSNIDANPDEETVYLSPRLKVVLINGSTAYVMLAEDHRTGDRLFSISLADIDRIHYFSPVSKLR